MTKNMGILDRTLRTMAALIIAWLVFNNTLTGTWAYIVLLVVVIFLLTSLFSFCPLYHLVGISTCGIRKK